MSPKLRSALFRQASLSATFISENGIVAVLGDENQLMKGDIRKISRPLSFERGHAVQIWGNDVYRWEVAFPEVIGLKYLPRFISQSPNHKSVDSLIL